MRRLVVPLIVVLAFVAGITWGGHPDLLPGFVRDTLVGDADTRVVREAIDKVHADYYREVPENELADAAIAGVVDSLDDRFSHYLNPEEYDRFQDVQHNAYAGVGIEVTTVKRGLRVVTVYDGSPAKRAGIRSGDVVLAADGTSLAGKAAERGPSLIKGPPGTDVMLRIARGDSVRTLKVGRAKVTVPVVASKLREVDGDKLGVVRLASFTSGAHGEVTEALEKLLERGAKGFVLDLRRNGGGLVTEAQLVASAFLDGGRIVTTRGRAVDEEKLDAVGDPVVPRAPLVVLVDKDTASASEIVAGALQDRDGATVVGAKTFGKGVFQTILELSNGGALDITAGQYFTPSGRNLGGKGVKTGAGIEPDVEAKDQPKTKEDEGLDEALDVLTGKLRVRETEDVVGLLAQRGRFLVAEPFFERGRRLTVERDKKAAPGRLALLRPPARGRNAKVVRMLGRPDVARDVIEALMLSRGLERRFPPGVEKAAEQARDTIEDRDEAGARRDLRDLPTFTIDPATAKDFDDAISCEELAPGEWRVWVHIADVTAYVKPGSPLDREAYRRATSVYVPGAVEPMLPQALSNDACSLVPGVERLAVSVEMELKGGAVVKAAFHRTRIRSDKRLDYEQVDRIFAGDERAGDPWAGPLAAARAASAALREGRARGSALVIDSAEPEFRFDRAGHVEGSDERVQTESHQLIEHLMIAANEQVARVLVERKIGALHRVHERPEPSSVQRLVAQLATLDVPTPPLPETLSPQQAADALGDISRLVDEHVRRVGHGRRALTSLVLRALKQAHYAPRPLGHAGLGLEHYCHFTSPIRRYPDIVCHRALLSAVGGGEEPPPVSALEEAGTWTSQRERDAMIIERDADDVARCFLLERTLFETGSDEVFDGEVVGVIGAGAFVAFGDGYQGLLPVRKMRGDWWELNEEGTMLRGEESGRAIRLGDPVQVRVERVDAPRGRVDLLPVS